MLLGLREVSVAYPGTLALDSVSFDIEPGEVLAVVGANGSGKTTLLSTICGIRRPTSGQLVTQERPVRFDRPSQALELGITMVPQEPQIADSLPVWENILMGSSRLLAGAPSRAARAAARATARESLPHIDPDQPAGELRKADRAVLGLIRALHRKPKILALDEPTAVLGENSVQVVDAAARAVQAAGGATVLVSHRLRDIVQLATRVVVLVDGRLVHDSPVSQVSVEELVDKIASGRAVSGRVATVSGNNTDFSAAGADNTLVLKDFRAGGVSIDELTIAPGQVLGLAGLAGSGRSRLLRAVAGHGPQEGVVTVGGKPLPTGATRRWRSGVAYVPEDRVREAMFDSLSVASNLEVGELAWGRLARPMPLRPDRRRTAADIDRFGVKTPSSSAPVTALSGGNQQRVVLARVLGRRPRVLIADEPTQGVDRAGRAAIHQLIRQFAAEGGVVLLVSSEFEELQALATDLAVLVDGRIVARRPPDTDYRELVALATGAGTEHLGSLATDPQVP